MGVFISFQLRVICEFSTETLKLVGLLSLVNLSDISLGCVPFLKSSVDIRFDGVYSDGNSAGNVSFSYLQICLTEQGSPQLR